MRQMYLDDDADADISKISFYTAAEGYVATYKWIAYTADSGRTFVKKYVTLTNVNYNNYTVNVTVGYYIWGVKAFNKNNIILWGHYGYVPAILYSSDGGNSFKLVFHLQFDPLQLPGGVLDMAFPGNGLTGYATDPDRILKTTDGGLTWTVNRAEPGSFYTRLEAVNENLVYAYSTENYSMLRTINGGSNWTSVTLPQLGSSIQSAYFSDSRGWVNVTGSQGNYVYMTPNSGNLWIQQNDPKLVPLSVSRMRFTDNNVGYALGDHYKVWKTYDGGKLWEPLARDNQFSNGYNTHYDLHFFNSRQFWAGGQHGFLEMTTNAGDTTVPQAYFKIDTIGLGATGSIQLTNYSKPGYQYRWYVNNAYVGNGYNANYVHDPSLYTDTVTLIVDNGRYKDSATQYQKFKRPPLPLPTGFSPVSGSLGTVITIKGSRFKTYYPVTNITIGGIPATSFEIPSDTVIYAEVADGNSGDIKITNDEGGTATLTGFNYIPPPTGAVPVITDFTPISGPVGTVVSIHGSNFDALPANNIVGLGGVNATVTAASTTQLTFTVPPGVTTSQLSVTNLVSHFSAIAEHPFGLTFAGSGNFTTHSFVPEMNFKKAVLTSDVHTADIDGDGKTDIACNIYLSPRDSIYVLRNQSTVDSVSFENAVAITGLISTDWHDITVRDMDGDGRPDVITHTNQEWIRVSRNLSTPGTIRFDTAFQQNIGPNRTTAETSEAMDLDADGRPDLAVSSFTDSSITLLRNTSSPGLLSFGKYMKLKLPGLANGVALGDLDGDGKKDIAAIASPSGLEDHCSLTIFRNNSSRGTLSFIDQKNWNIPSTIFHGRTVRILDFDGDGKPDVFLGLDDGYFVFRNTSTPGNITFAQPLSYPKVWQINEGGSVFELNGDGKPDIISDHNGHNQFILYRNMSVPGTAAIDSQVVIDTQDPYYLFGVSVVDGDFNGDGRTDIALSNGYGGSIAIYKNNMGEKVDLKNCEGDTQIITADMPGSSFQWQVNSGAGFTNMVNSADIRGTDSVALVLSRLPLTMEGYMFRCLSRGYTGTVYTLHISAVTLPTVTLSTPQTTICAGTEVTFTPNLINPGRFPYYHWQINGKNVGTGNSTYVTSTLEDSSVVRVIAGGYDACTVARSDTSNTILMIVNGGIPSVTIAASATTVCKGAAVTFTATPVWGGTPSYQWQVNGVNTGTNSPVFTSSTLKNIDLVKVIMTANGYCLSPTPVTSNSILMKVNDYVTPTVTIAAAQTTICAGDIITFLPTPVNGGTSPSYEWRLNGIAAGNAAYYTSTSLRPGDNVQCKMTSSFACLLAPTAESNIVTLTQGVCISANNFTVQAFGATCYDKNNGSIHIAVKQDLGYTVNVNSPSGYSASTHFNGTDYLVEGLPAGSYTVCFVVDNVPGYSKCFTVKITEPPPLRVMASVDEKQITLSLNGGSSYMVSLNGTTFITGDSIVQLSLQEGINEITVGTGQSCQGIYSGVFITGNGGPGVQVFPNPAMDETTVYIPAPDDKVQVKIINAATGSIINSRAITLSASRLIRLPLKGLAAGIYIIQVNGQRIDQSVKLVKQ